MKSEEQIIKEHYDKKKLRFHIILHNIIESFKPTVGIGIIGLPLAAIFWLASLRILDTTKELYSIHGSIMIIGLIFFYGCLFHDLVQPYLKTNYIKLNQKGGK